MARRELFYKTDEKEATQNFQLEREGGKAVFHVQMLLVKLLVVSARITVICQQFCNKIETNASRV